jgi:hypothetical protein
MIEPQGQSDRLVEQIQNRETDHGDRDGHTDLWERDKLLSVNRVNWLTICRKIKLYYYLAQWAIFQWYAERQNSKTKEENIDEHSYDLIVWKVFLDKTLNLEVMRPRKLLTCSQVSRHWILRKSKAFENITCVLRTHGNKWVLEKRLGRNVHRGRSHVFVFLYTLRTCHSAWHIVGT